MEKVAFYLLRSHSIFLTQARFIAHQKFFSSHLLRKLPPSSCIFYKSDMYKSSLAVEQQSSKPSFLQRVKIKIFNKYLKSTKVKIAAAALYEKCADDLDYSELFKHFNLPDSFHSWFLLTELHVWMCCVRVVSEEYGKTSRHNIMECMWSDVELRMKKLSHLSSKIRRQYLKDINEQFRAAILSYDEGFFGDDTDLGASIWRTLYGFKCDDPRLIEDMVSYIRKQVSHLDSLNSEKVMYKGEVSWLPLQVAVQKSSSK